MVNQKLLQDQGAHNHYGVRIKICSLLAWAAVSVLIGGVLDFAASCFVGPTSRGTWINEYWIGFFAIASFMSGACFVFRHDMRTKPENLFLCIVLCLSCFSVWAFSINEISWDVGIHYEHALEYSEPDRSVEMSLADAEMALLGYNRIETSLSELDTWKSQLDEAVQQPHGNLVRGKMINLYNRVASLPSSLILMMCKALNTPYSVMYVLGQIAIALIYSFVTFFGMRRLKTGKILFATIALYPTMIILASNYSYDYWVNAFSMFGIAYLIGELQRPEERLSAKNAILMLGAFVIGLAPKGVYFPLILLCLLIPKTKFSNDSYRRIYRLGVIASTLFVVASFLLPMLFNGVGSGDSRGGSDVNASAQLAYILSNPIEYLQTFVTFTFETYLAPLSTQWFILRYGYLGFPSWFFWALAAAMTIFAAIVDKGPEDVNVNTWHARVLTLVICAICVFGVVTALYLSFTAVGSNTVAGCQPRYILPLIFPFMVFMGSYKFAWPRSDAGIAIRNTCMLALMACVYMGGLWQLYIGLLV